ncbi:MAG: hypothetical protein LKJ47_05965 [Bifidobacteriaceae bacterium]|jgi:hypothetical protein|nr:hypothetical protein [Bifidobacteriaceae bacterium]
MESKGIITMLDTTAGYLTAASRTLFGRAGIATHLVPKKTIAASTTAFWIWFSGTLPTEITVISASHFRSLAFGRRITAFNRATPPEDLRHIGSLTLTSPLRTACDVACLPRDEFDRTVGSLILFSFLQFYEIPLQECRAAILKNPRRPGFANGLCVLNEKGTL